MKYSPEEIEVLKKYIFHVQERIDYNKRIIADNSDDFNDWYKYSIPEDRFIYQSILGINTEIGRMFHNNLCWLSDEKYKYMSFDIEFIINCANNLIESGVQIDVEEIKKEIVKLNFGSMINKW